MKNRVFLDLGFYYGGIIKAYANWGVVDRNWTIYAFDPNPSLDVDGAVSKLGLPVTFSTKAAWVRNEPLSLHMGNLESAASLGFTSNNPEKTIPVQGFDFSAWLNSFNDSYIICSMDIEGAEYALLEKLLEDDTIKKINVLDIEFHHRFMKDKETRDSEALLKRVMNAGVTVRLKVPFE